MTSPPIIADAGPLTDDDLSATTTAKERLEMMWPMTVDAWTLAGKKIPEYPRDKTPVRNIRRGKPRRGDGM